MREQRYIVRRAQREDCMQIYGFICALEECDFDVDVFKDIYIRNIQHPDNIYLVAEGEASLCGYISCHGQFLLHHNGRVFEIQEFYVSPEHRGIGIGQALVRNLEAALKPFNAISLEVTAQTKREKTHAFYAKMGFQFTHLKFTKEIT